MALLSVTDALKGTSYDAVLRFARQCVARVSRAGGDVQVAVGGGGGDTQLGNSGAKTATHTTAEPPKAFRSFVPLPQGAHMFDRPVFVCAGQGSSIPCPGGGRRTREAKRCVTT